MPFDTMQELCQMAFLMCRGAQRNLLLRNMRPARQAGRSLPCSIVWDFEKDSIEHTTKK